mmetsp:Transcript_13861/g.33921  ORF Transcript_13861/g.33921 Transcript_13861/m.33921 type:complete len:83 (-) Transcript_13861:354-602(-)
MGWVTDACGNHSEQVEVVAHRVLTLPMVLWPVQHQPRWSLRYWRDQSQALRLLRVQGSHRVSACVAEKVADASSSSHRVHGG